jgi:predicted PurR-regulated permease PerM
MTRRTWPLIALGVVGGLLATIVIVYVLFRIRGVLLLFLIGLVIAYILDPLLDLLERRGWSRSRGVWFLSLCLVGVGAILAALVVPPAVSQAQTLASNLGAYVQSLSLSEQQRAEIEAIGVAGVGVEAAEAGTEVEVVLSTTPFEPERPGAIGDSGEIVSDTGRMTVRRVRALRDGTVGHMGVVESGSISRGQTVTASVNLVRRRLASGAAWVERVTGVSVTAEHLADVDARVRAWLGRAATRVAQYATGQAIALLSNVVTIIIVPVIAFHFMREIDFLRRWLLERVPDDRKAGVAEVSRQISTMLGGYLRGLAIVSAAIGTTSAIVLHVLHFIFGMEYALLLGIVTGLTYAVPYIGPTVSAVLAGIVGYATATSHPLLCGGLAAGLMIAANQVFDNILMPRIVGHRVGLHPLAVLFALMAGYALWGILGMIVAVPLTASLKIILWHAVPQLAGTAGEGVAAEHEEESLT